MHEVLVKRLGGLSLPRKSVVRLTDRPDMTLDVYRGRKTTIQQMTSLASILLSSQLYRLEVLMMCSRVICLGYALATSQLCRQGHDDVL